MGPSVRAVDTSFDSPRMNKRNPHELHWRSNPNEWQGNLEFAYEHYYRHLNDKVYCRHCGAIPCPIDHEESKKDKLQDMQFVKDMVEKRKELQGLVNKVRVLL